MIIVGDIPTNILDELLVNHDFKWPMATGNWVRNGRWLTNYGWLN